MFYLSSSSLSLPSNMLKRLILARTLVRPYTSAVTHRCSDTLLPSCGWQRFPSASRPANFASGSLSIRTTTAKATWTILRSYTTTSPNEPRFQTLAFYKFHNLPAASLDQLRSQLLTDLGGLGILGRIYISTEGINAQVSCPESVIEKLRAYCTTSIAPLVGGDLMDLNFGTQGDSAAFRALHVRIRKQLVADGLDPSSYDLENQPSHLSPEDWHAKLAKYKMTHGKEPVLIDMRNHYER